MLIFKRCTFPIRAKQKGYKLEKVLIQIKLSHYYTFVQLVRI